MCMAEWFGEKLNNKYLLNILPYMFVIWNLFTNNLLPTDITYTWYRKIYPKISVIKFDCDSRSSKIVSLNVLPSCLLLINTVTVDNKAYFLVADVCNKVCVATISFLSFFSHSSVYSLIDLSDLAIFVITVLPDLFVFMYVLLCL